MAAEHKSSRAISICSPKIKQKKTTKKRKKSLKVCLNGQRKAVREINFFEVWGKIGLNTVDFFNNLNSATNALSEFGGKISKEVIDPLLQLDSMITGISDTVFSTIAAGVKEISEAARGLAESVVQEGMSFDSAMGQVSATLLRTREDFDAETVSVEGFSGSLRELAKEMGAKTKFTATQAGEALNFMALAGYDAQTSAEMLPKVLNLAAAGAMDLATASDMVTDSQTALGIKIQDMTAFIDQMAKTASSSNTSVAQLGDAILSIGATGRQVKGGFTELNTVLGVLADNGIKASESGNMLRRLLTNLTTAEGEAKEQLDKLGVSVFDAQDNMRDLPSIFLELEKAMSGLTDKERTQAVSDIFSQYSLAGANALLKTSAERWEELGEKIKDSEGAAKAMADIQLNTLPGQITIVQSALSGLKIELYDKISPELTNFVESLSSGLSNVKDAITDGDFQEAFMRLGETAVELFNRGFAFIVENGDTIAELTKSIVAAIDKTATELLNSATEYMPALLRIAFDIADTIITGAANFFENPENIDKLRAIVNLILTRLQNFLDEHEDDIFTIVNTVFDVAIGFVSKIFVLRRKTTADIIWREIQEIVQPVGENVANFVLLQIDRLDKFFDDNFKKPLETAKKNLSNWWDGIKTKVSAAITKIGAWVTESTDLIKTGFNDLKTKATTWGSDLIQGFIDGIKSKYEEFKNKITEIAGTISEFLHFSAPDKGPLANYEKWMPDFMQGMAQGIEKNRDLIKNAAKNVADDISNYTPAEIQSNAKSGTIQQFNNVFNIGSVNANSEQDAENFAKNVSKLLYNDIVRSKRGVYA